MTPILILRLHCHFKYRRSYPEQFIEQYRFANFMFHGMYGIWTQYNLVRYYHLDKACKAI